MSTDITLGADGFDVYDIYLTPTTLVFHLREFNVRGSIMGICVY